MTVATDWRSVTLPERLQTRPRDRRGFPIPYSIDDGSFEPDFRMVQPARAAELLRSRACWLCGQGPTYWMTFVGGPLSIGNRMFLDGWMHEECALYALSVCPFLANPRGRYTTPEDEGHPDVHPARPETFGLGYTRDYRLSADPRGSIVIVPLPFKRVRWFSHFGIEIGS